MIRNTSQAYGIVSIGLHWLMAVMIMLMIVVGFLMSDMESGATKFEIVQLHKATGLVVLILAMIRWYWMITNDKLAPLDSWSAAETAMAHASKWLLMLLMVLMPVSGMLMSLSGGHDISIYGIVTVTGFEQKNESLNELTHEAHEVGAYLITLIVAAHIVAALKHHLIRKDRTLLRIIGH